MENNNQQFNEENAKQFSKTLGALGMALVLIANKANPNDIGLKKEDIANFLKAIDKGKTTYDIFKELSEVWDQVEVSKEEEVVRIYNEVGNKFAISTDGIGQAVQRSGDALTSIEPHQKEIKLSKEDTSKLLETVNLTKALYEGDELFKAANLTVQDPIKVGKSLRTITMRLNGLDEDGNEIDGLKNEIEKKLNSYGLTLKNDEKKIKSLYEVIGDLHSAWGDINDIDRAYILELIAGKMHGNVIASAIYNWSCK